MISLSYIIDADGFVIVANLTSSPVVNNVACSSKKAFRVWCSNVTFTCVIVQTTVVRVDDVDDILFVAADC